MSEGGGVESEFGTLDFKYSRHNVTGSTEKPVQHELHRFTGELNVPHHYTFNK